MTSSDPITLPTPGLFLVDFGARDQQRIASIIIAHSDPISVVVPQSVDRQDTLLCREGDEEDAFNEDAWTAAIDSQEAGDDTATDQTPAAPSSNTILRLMSVGSGGLLRDNIQPVFWSESTFLCKDAETFFYFATEFLPQPRAQITKVKVLDFYADDTPRPLEIREAPGEAVTDTVVNGMPLTAARFPGLQSLTLSNPRSANGFVLAATFNYLLALCRNSPGLKRINVEWTLAESVHNKINPTTEEGRRICGVLGEEETWTSVGQYDDLARRVDQAAAAALFFGLYSGSSEWKRHNGDWTISTPGPRRLFLVLVAALNVCLEKRADARTWSDGPDDIFCMATMLREQLTKLGTWIV